MIIIYIVLLNFGLSHKINSRPLLQLNDTLSYYHDAIKIIQEESPNKIIKNKARFSVSPEMPSFFLLGWGFKSEIENYFHVDEREFIDSSNLKIKIDPILMTLGRKKIESTKIFFSPIKKNLFFVEVIHYRSNSLKYSDRPIFGTSQIFMLKIKDGKVLMIATKEMNYN